MIISSAIRARRSYQAWVANETMEDYALRYAAKSFKKKWSPFTISNTALGGISFLALEAIGGTITLNYGFVNKCVSGNYRRQHRYLRQQSSNRLLLQSI